MNGSSIAAGPQGGKDCHGGHFGVRGRGADGFGLHAIADGGPKVKAGESFGEIESVKAVSDLYSPVDGEVVEVNSALAEQIGNIELRSLRRRLDGENQTVATRRH